MRINNRQGAKIAKKEFQAFPVPNLGVLYVLAVYSACAYSSEPPAMFWAMKLSRSFIIRSMSMGWDPTHPWP